MPSGRENCGGLQPFAQIGVRGNETLLLMPRTTFLRYSLIAWLLISGFLRGADAVVDNESVLKMHQAGLSEQTILMSIQKGPTQFDTSPNALIALKEAGISEAIIQQVVFAGGKGATGPGAPATAAPVSADESEAAVPPPPSAQTGVFWGNYPSIAPPFIQEPVVGKDYYTRFSLRVERGDYRAANYGRGLLIPINTRVKLLEIKEKTFLLQRLDNAEEIKVENEPKYTGRTAAGFATLLLSAEETPLARLPQPVAAAIRLGEPRRGMTKELVLMARGYPPTHETPSTESDRWVYWSSRFVKQTLVFSDGRLTAGRGIQ